MSLNGKVFKIDKHSGDFFRCSFTILLQIQHENNFLPIPVDTDNAKLVAFLVFVIRLLHLSLKFRVPKISRSESPSWLRSQNSEQPIAKDIPSYGSQSKRAKSAIHRFGKY